MNIIKKLLLTFFIAISLGSSSFAFAEDPAATEVIGHVEQAIVEVGKGDFNASYLHLKAARSASDKIVGKEAAVKQGLLSLIHAQILGKSADTEKTTAELNKALSIYKSI